MEQINQTAARLQIVETKPSETTLQSSRSYAAKVAELITKARAGSQSVLAGDEFKFAIAAWTEVLEGFVPEKRLNDCYLHARRYRNSTFPLDASELCAAWKEISESERARPPVATLTQRLRGDVCGQCNGTGYKQVEVNGYKVSKPCDCEPESED